MIMIMIIVMIMIMIIVMIMIMVMILVVAYPVAAMGKQFLELKDIKYGRKNCNKDQTFIKFVTNSVLNRKVLPQN